MKSDHARKMAVLKKIAYRTVNSPYDIEIHFDQSRRVIGMDFVRESGVQVELSRLKELDELFRPEEIEVFPTEEHLSIWMTGVTRWPWEM